MSNVLKGSIIIFATLLIVIQLLLIVQPEHLSLLWRPTPVPKKIYIEKDDEKEKREDDQYPPRF